MRALLLLVALLLGGCSAPATPAAVDHAVRIYVENNTYESHRFEANLSDGSHARLDSTVGTVPNVGTIWSGRVATRVAVSLQADGPSGPRTNLGVDVDRDTWIVISLNEGGSYDASVLAHEPRFD